MKFEYQRQYFFGKLCYCHEEYSAACFVWKYSVPSHQPTSSWYWFDINHEPKFPWNKKSSTNRNTTIMPIMIGLLLPLSTIQCSTAAQSFCVHCTLGIESVSVYEREEVILSFDNFFHAYTTFLYLELSWLFLCAVLSPFFATADVQQFVFEKLGLYVCIGSLPNNLSFWKLLGY